LDLAKKYGKRRIIEYYEEKEKKKMKQLEIFKINAKLKGNLNQWQRIFLKRRL